MTSRPPKWLLATLQVGAVIAAIVLTMANAPAPPIRLIVQVKEQAGDLEIGLDERVYADKPLEARLPAGEYVSVLLVRHHDRVTRDEKTGAPVAEERTSLEVWRLEGGDPRLEGDPIRLTLLPTEETGLHREAEVDPSELTFHDPATYELRVTTADGSETTLVFDIVDVTK